MSRLAYISAALLALGLTACGAVDDHGHDHADGGGHADDADGGHGDEGDHGHGHGGGVVVTNFTDTAELFVEFPPSLSVANRHSRRTLPASTRSNP